MVFNDLQMADLDFKERINKLFKTDPLFLGPGEGFERFGVRFAVADRNQEPGVAVVCFQGLFEFIFIDLQGQTLLISLH